MKTNRLITAASLLALLLACAPSTAQQHADHDVSDTDVEAHVTPEGPIKSIVPASAEALSKRLRARHIEDLPDAAALLKYDDVEASLIWIAGHDDMMVVRVRALGMLRHAPSPLGLDALVERATAETIHPTLRAAAMRGLEGHNSNDVAVAILTKAMRHTDQRVAVAAGRALSSNPNHADLLKAAAHDPEVHEALREKIITSGL